MCFLVILGLLMGWLSPQRDRPASISDSDGADPPKSLSEKQAWAPPSIPEMYLLPQRIPVKSDGLPAVAEAERVVRSRR